MSDEGLYHYGYILRPQELERLDVTGAVIEETRAVLAALRPDVKKVKLNTITTTPHHAYNKGYKISADPAAAALTLENVDFERRLAVVRARLERLPPAASDVLFRYLEVYVVWSLDELGPRWAVACVGGYYLE